MTQNQWLHQSINELIEESREYKQKALLVAIAKHIEEQENRIEQMEGQIDGTLWSPSQWRLDN